MKLRSIAWLLLPAIALLWAPAAHAEEGAGGDLEKKIKKKLAAILELMKQNEQALIELSTGGKATPRKVDVDVPPPPAGSKGSSGEQGSSGTQGTQGAGKSGREVGKKLDELISGQRKQGSAIPDELKELVEMIPL